MSAITAGTLGIDGVAAPEQFFVINLCSSTSPMALSHPATPELKRYTFFVSRQRDEGRERFRLHMGYFATQAEAEELLATVRDIYPAAWAGPAPTSGVPRRGKIVPVKLAPEVAQATVAVVAPAAAAVPASAPVAADAGADMAFTETMTSVRAALAQLSVEEPTLITVEPLSPAEELSLLETPAPKVVAPPPPAPKAAAPAPSAAPAKAAAPVPPARTAASPAPAKAAPAAAPAASHKAAAASAAAPVTPAAPAAASPSRTAAPAAPLPRSAAAQAPVSPSPAAAAKGRPAPPPEAPVSPHAGLENEPEVRVLTPEDTQTLRDIKLDAQNNAPPCFAVQLLWSVSPIDISALPHLAIFDAYKLYNVEGSRQGRKWFGLRLGFFSDPNSATQVANYVRSDYRSVAVVPVAIKERDHASGSHERLAAPRLGASDAPMKHATDVAVGREKLDGFELLADDKPVPARRDIEGGAEQAAGKQVPVLNPPVVKPAAAAKAGKPTGKPTGKRVVARPRANMPLNRAAPGKPNSLESTLEILGASTLSLADEGREIINDSAIREPEKKPGSKFSKLLGRLSGN